MRRWILALVVVSIGMAAVILSTGLTRERDFQRLIAEGDRARQDEQPFVAVEAYSGALALRPDSMLVYLKRGETHQAQGDPVAAHRDLSMAAQLDPTAPRPHERLGDLAYARGRYDEAVDHFTSFVRLDDGNPRVLYKLALASERTGEIARAVPLLRQAIDQDPLFAEAHYLLGLCLREQGRLEEAREALGVAIETSPGLLSAREALAQVLHVLGDHRGELRQLDALAALDQEHPERHVASGLAYARTGQTDLAVLALGRAAEEHPDQPQVYAALGKVWLEIAEARGDRVALGKALEALLAVPTPLASSETLTVLGRAQLVDGDAAAARATLRLAVERFPADPEAFLHLARLEEQAHNWDEGRRLRRAYQVLTTDPTSRAPRIATPTG